MNKTELHTASWQWIVLEVLAIVFGLLYTVLFILEVQYCFVFAIIGAIIYAFLCVKKKIFAEVFLQLFYIPMAIYGWLNWGEYGENSFSRVTHVIFLGSTVFATLAVGYLLKKNTESKLPYWDAFTTVFSLTATWLMVNFIHEMWLYFIAVNTVSMFLYYQRGMKLSVFLYAFYVYLSVSAWFGWELIF